MPNCIFRVGDKVRRRPGTVGADGAVGEVVNIETQTFGYGAIEMLTVRFEDGRTETFYWGNYESVETHG